MDDSFEIYDLKVEVTATERPMVCSHHVGDYFLVEALAKLAGSDPMLWL